MLGMQLQAIDQSSTSAEITDIILEEMKERGFLIGKNGLNRDVLAFQPPLVIEKEDIDAMILNLQQTLDQIAQ
jgi:4-aminobutyrate aminotransferase